MPRAEKAMKERLYTNACGKERKQTTNACGKEKKTKRQRLVANEKWLPNQASKQLTPNERNKTAETTSKPQPVAKLQAQGGEKKKTQKSPPNHTCLTDYRLQQRSGQLQS